MLGCLFFLFKQKTAYEMRISDWSSDVCSSDLPDQHLETEGDETHPLSANARQQRAERDADGRDHDHERLVARISEDHCDEAKGIDRLGKPVICIEAGVDRESGRCGAHHCEGKRRSEEHTSELQSLMRISYAVFCLKKTTPLAGSNTHKLHQIDSFLHNIVTSLSVRI